HLLQRRQRRRLPHLLDVRARNRCRKSDVSVPGSGSKRTQRKAEFASRLGSASRSLLADDLPSPSGRGRLYRIIVSVRISFPSAKLPFPPSPRGRNTMLGRLLHSNLKKSFLLLLISFVAALILQRALVAQQKPSF